MYFLTWYLLGRGLEIYLFSKESAEKKEDEIKVKSNKENIQKIK